MKYYIIFILLFLSSIACSQTKHVTQNDQYMLYRITKIKKEKSIFIIYAQKNDSVFKIVSETKEKNIFDCAKIKKGKYYDLDLNIIYPVEYYPLLGVKGPTNFLDVIFTLNGVAVPLEEKSHYKLYEAKNLKGLCLIEDNE